MASPARKLTDVSFVWLKENKCYSAIDIMSRVDATALVTVEYELYGDYEISPQDFKKYLELRKLPRVHDSKHSLIGKHSCYGEDNTAIVEVSSLSRKGWEEGRYYHVKIVNLLPDSVSFEEKKKSFRNLIANCNCHRSIYQSICKPPLSKRMIFKDLRNYKDIPQPNIDSIFCKHVCVALDYCHLFYSTASFEFFGPSEHTRKVSQSIIKDFLERKLRLPNYQLNSYYLGKLREEGINFFQPLLKYIF